MHTRNVKAAAIRLATRTASTASAHRPDSSPAELPVHDLVNRIGVAARETIGQDDVPGTETTPLIEAGRRRRIFRMAAMLLGSGKAEDALTVFDYLTLLDPFRPAYWVAGGLARMQLGMNDEAAGSFQIAESADEADPVPVLMRALCRLRQGRECEAAAALRRAHSLVLASGETSWIKATIERHLSVVEGRGLAPAAA